jgi:hypothetical protein
MYRSDSVKNSLYLHHSPTYKYSIGYKGEYYRKDRISLNGLQLNNLLQRWNFPSSQCNIYLKSNIGNAHKLDKDELYGSVGISGDFESRKYFISYENIYYKSDGNIIANFFQSLQIGFAPYVENYGNLHIWTMLKISHHQEAKDGKLIIAPFVRMFKEEYFVELGFDFNRRILFNFIKRF